MFHTLFIHPCVISKEAENLTEKQGKKIVKGTPFKKLSSKGDCVHAQVYALEESTSEASHCREGDFSTIENGPA